MKQAHSSSMNLFGQQAGIPHRNWFTSMQLRTFLAYGACLLINILYSSFSIVASEPLRRLDAIIVTTLQFVVLLPAGICFLARFYRLLTNRLLLNGISMGACLAIALICLTYSLENTGITETVVFAYVNGVLATCIAVAVFRQRQSLLTWCACALSLLGVLLIWHTGASHWQGNITALVGASLLTVFAFLVERLLLAEIKEQPEKLWPILGVLLITMATLSLIIALCFGDWECLRAWRPTDGPVIAYTSIFTVLVPLLLTIKAQRYVSAVSIAFFAILEPLLSASYAFLSGERMLPLAYLGGLIILIGVLLQALASARATTSAHLPATAPHDQLVTPIAQTGAEVSTPAEAVRPPRAQRNDSAEYAVTIIPPAPRFRLFCVPPPGQNTAFFQLFPRLLPADLQATVEICPIDIAGWAHPSLHSGQLLYRQSLVRDLLLPSDPTQSPLYSYLHVPFAILGVHQGGLLSFALAQGLAQCYHCPPQALFIAACAAPQPVDVQRFQLSCPLAVCGSKNDSTVTLQELAAWQHTTSGPLRLHILPDDHALVQHASPTVWAHLLAYYAHIIRTILSGQQFLGESLLEKEA